MDPKGKVEKLKNEILHESIRRPESIRRLPGDAVTVKS
jgi:hypothetical protein